MRSLRILLFDLDKRFRTGEAVRNILQSHFQRSVKFDQVVLDGPIESQTKRMSQALEHCIVDIGLFVFDDSSISRATELVEVFRQRTNRPVLPIGPFIDPKGLEDLLKRGAIDFACLPVNSAELIMRVSRGVPMRTEGEASFMRGFNQKISPWKFVTQNLTVISELKKLVRFAVANETVLLTGETGTGKEICARAVWLFSPRSNRPYVVVNCGAIPTELAEAKLFGHMKGAFTGATTTESGNFLEADGGTLFLDEINSLPLAVQPKLLRAIETGEIDVVGSSKSVKVDVRIIAASNKDLEEECAAGRFREDLRQRLNVLDVSLPPLRERLDDIPLLASEFLRIVPGDGIRKRLSIGALDKLLAHNWKGNVRELSNVIKKVAALSTGADIDPHEINLNGNSGLHHGESLQDERSRTVYAATKASLERRLLKTGWNVTRAAREGKVDPGYLRWLLRKHDLKRPRI